MRQYMPDTEAVGTFVGNVLDAYAGAVGTDTNWGGLGLDIIDQYSADEYRDLLLVVVPIAAKIVWDETIKSDPVGALFASLGGH